MSAEPAGCKLQGIARNGAATDASSHRAAQLFLRRSFRRIRNFLRDLNNNEDRELLATANAVLGKGQAAGRNGR